MRDHCAHARFVWNLAVEQQSWWRPGRQGAPGLVEQSRQLTQVRAGYNWLAAGSVTVQQQALRDFAQAMANFFNGTRSKPTWRKAGRDEGFRIVALRPGQIRRLTRRWGQVYIPKAGWVRFRWSRAVPQAKSYRVKLDRAGRWHVAFAVIPAPIEGPGTGEVVGVDRGVAVSAALSTGELLSCPRLSPGRLRRLKALQRRLNREIFASGWGILVRRLEEKAPGRIERINPAYTSQRCSECGHVAGENRKSQAVFVCTACRYAANADVNAARNIAAGHAVTVREGSPVGRPVNREPQLALQST